MNIGILKYSYVFVAVFFSVSMVFPSGLSQNLWKVKPFSEIDQTYHALIVKPYLFDTLHTYCSGVVLNDRYVLTMFRCTRYAGGYWTKEKVQLYVNFTYFIENFNTSNTITDGIFHEIDYVWPTDFDEFLRPDAIMPLLRTKKRIKFDYKFICINLPKGPYWQYMNPERVNLTTSFFRGTETYKRTLEIMEGYRDCTIDMVKDIPLWYIPTCILYPLDVWVPMQWTLGYPLVYNNTLIGMRNYLSSRYGPPPHYHTPDGVNLYVNLALVANFIESQMKDYTPCSSIST